MAVTAGCSWVCHSTSTWVWVRLGFGFGPWFSSPVFSRRRWTVGCDSAAEPGNSPVWLAESGVTFIPWHLHDLIMHPHTHSSSHTRSLAGCPGVRQQTLFNLFSSALIGSKLPSLPSWCANECGIEGRPPITPQAHLQDTSGCQAAVCDLYMADEGGARGCKVVSTDLDQRDWSWGKNPRVNYCSGSPEAVHVTPTPNEVYLHHPAILEFMWYLIMYVADQRYVQEKVTNHNHMYALPDASL